MSPLDPTELDRQIDADLTRAESNLSRYPLVHREFTVTRTDIVGLLVTGYALGVATCLVIAVAWIAVAP